MHLELRYLLNLFRTTITFCIIIRDSSLKLISKFCLLVIGFLLIIHVPVVVVYLSGNRRVSIIIIMNNATTLFLSRQFHSHFIVFFSSNDLRRSCFLKMSRNTVQLHISFQGSVTSSYNSISLYYPHR